MDLVQTLVWLIVTLPFITLGLCWGTDRWSWGWSGTCMRGLAYVVLGAWVLAFGAIMVAVGRVG